MTAPDPRLDEIQARLNLHYEEIAYFSGTARHYCAEDGENWPCADVVDYAQDDIRYLLAELRKAREALAAAWDEGAQAEADTTMLTEHEEAAGEHAATFVCPSCNPYRAAVAAASGDGRG